MMADAAVQCGSLLKQYDRWLAGLDDRHLALEPAPGLKTAGWLIGHLVVTGDFARRLCGLPPIAPKDWRPLFAKGTLPSPDHGVYPPMRELIETFRSVYDDLRRHSPLASAETLAAPNPLESARPTYPTAGDFAVYLQTGHLGYHLGQLSMWRAVAAASDPALRA